MKNKFILETIVNIILFVFVLSFIFPILFTVNFSFKSAEDVYGNPLKLPVKWMFSNYPNVLQEFEFFLFFTNTLIYTAFSILITIFLGSMFAYSSSRLSWKFNNVVMSYMALGLIIPPQIIIIPLFIIIKNMNLLNTYLSLVIPYTAFGLPRCALMMYAFMRTLPKELEEAGIIDGCNIYKVYFRIILPMVKPAIATQIVVLFMFAWNDFFFAFILTTTEKMKTLAIGLYSFQEGLGSMTHWGYIGAAMMLTSLPALVVYFLFSEKIEEALTSGAILK